MRSPDKFTSRLPRALLFLLSFPPATGNVDQIEHQTRQRNRRSAQKEAAYLLFIFPSGRSGETPTYHGLEGTLSRALQSIAFEQGG
jgi:hypothetical protein